MTIGFVPPATTDYSFGFNLNSSEFNSRQDEIEDSLATVANDLAPRQIVSTGIAGENIAAGSVVRIGTSGNLFNADATTSTNAFLIIGIAIETKTTGQVIRYTRNALYGTSGLTAGMYYYLSNTPGAVSTTPGTITILIGVALTSTILYMAIDRRPGNTLSVNPFTNRVGINVDAPAVTLDMSAGSQTGGTYGSSAAAHYIRSINDASSIYGGIVWIDTDSGDPETMGFYMVRTSGRNRLDLLEGGDNLLASFEDPQISFKKPLEVLGDIYTAEWQDVGAVSGDFTGFSALTTNKVWLKFLGNVAFFNIKVEGTSNGTTFVYASDVTFGSGNDINYTSPVIYAKDNGTAVSAYAEMVPGSADITFKRLDGSAWTASGTKALYASFIVPQ